MRPILVLLAFVVLGGISVQARAQAQASPPQADSEVNNEEAAGNVPSMVVREAVVQDKKDVVTIPATGRYKSKPVVFTGQPSVGAMDVTTGNTDYDKMVMESAVRNEVDPNLIMAVMRQESGFNPHSHSYKGACGLMQLMPDTARRFGVVNIYDAKQNIEGGAKYLRFLLDKFDGDVSLTLAGYNAGEMAVVGAGYRVPRYRETQNYVRSISARYGSAGKVPALKEGKVAAKLPGAVVLSDGSSSVLSNNY